MSAAGRARAAPQRRRHEAPSALVVIDMINALDFAGGAALLRSALPCARRIALLKSRVSALGLPVIYANDNYGQWRSDFRQVVAACAQEGSRGAALARLLQPQPDDYFVLKPQHSAFHGTPLERLLADLGVRRLVLTGIAADSCVLATALAAHMRGYSLYVPTDCVAAESPARKRRSLDLLRVSFQVDTRRAAWITRRELVAA